MIIGIFISLSLLTLGFTAYFAKDLFANKKNFESNTNYAIASGIGFVGLFLDTLGIGSFAPMTALLRAFKQISDRLIPGTLNVSCSIPVMFESFIFISVIQVEAVTLISMVIAAIVGSVIGAGIVAKLPERKVQLIIGVALLITASLMVFGRLGWIAGLGTGDAIGLSDGKLAIALIANSILGALQSAGIGMYGPCMALVYILGMSPRVAFPIMATSGAFAQTTASIKFVKEGVYNKKASLAINIAGIGGVFIAAYIVRSLPLDVLSWFIIVVIVYTSSSLLLRAVSARNLFVSAL